MKSAIVFGAIAVTGILFGVGAAIPGHSDLKTTSSCGECGEVQVQAAPKQKNVVVVGVLTNEGVECQALRADNGTLYTLSGKLKKFQVGDRVRVEGQIADFSFCQQGITIDVTKIKKAS